MNIITWIVFGVLSVVFVVDVIDIIQKWGKR